MNVVDERLKTMPNFSELKIGEGFEFDNVLFIKVTQEDAFDVLNNHAIFFNDKTRVIRRDVDIIFY